MAHPSPSTFAVRTIHALLLGAAHLLTASVGAQSTVRVSESTQGVEGDASSLRAVVSADGRFVAFQSLAGNLVPGDTNGVMDCFVHDLGSGVTERISVGSSGAQGSRRSQDVSISADGRYVAFSSAAIELVPGDTNGFIDVFVRDRATRTTVRASIGVHGLQGNGPSEHPSISADGRWVAFQSWSDNLVFGDTSQNPECFVRDLRDGVTVRVSVASGGVQAWGSSTDPVISADGRFVAFDSTSPVLVPGDTNGVGDVFVHDLATRITERISVGANGEQATNYSWRPRISADGRVVAFHSSASNLVPGDANLSVDCFVHDRSRRTTERVSISTAGIESNGASSEASLSADGRLVAFDSRADNLVPGDSNGRVDCFVRDRLAGTTERVSIGTGGTQGNGDAWNPSLSADGRSVAFESEASDLVSGDGNASWDAFVRDRGAGTGTSADTIVLTGQARPAIGTALELSWYAAPPAARWWLLISEQNLGSTIGGHPFGIGPGGRIQATGRCDARGRGVFTSEPLPAWTSGRTIYVEIGARDGGGRVWDSNLLERIVL